MEKAQQGKLSLPPYIMDMNGNAVHQQMNLQGAQPITTHGQPMMVPAPGQIAQTSAQQHMSTAVMNTGSLSSRVELPWIPIDENRLANIPSMRID